MKQSWTYSIQQEGQTIDELLRDQWKLGKKTVHELRMTKAISDTNGELLQWKLPRTKGTEIVVTLDVPESSYEATLDCDVKVIYEDQDCLIVSKPKGMATHPNDVWDRDTCMNHVMKYVQDQGGVYAEHAHRLDQGTSGLLLVAKHPIAKSIFDRLLEEKKIVRVYEAEVQGHMKERQGTIRGPIAKDRHHGTRRRVSPEGQMAITNFEVVRHLEHSTVVNLVLETGRTHQIRVHLAYIGHPIVGDTLYDARETASGDYSLHARKLKFIHPFTGTRMEILDK
ncbi:RluA family pseudouridine synthase [Viridibacillus sp. YIM B01967]|uniref:Pseudouridine synthase n=1 Tax=Viridibacillus soli TaxID=2798301 RepID=A0ABS1HD04_9BACL|nr:RluA family pseudouridine synthase [Viridibacillus soli]MBK3496962.1 RluA family pseudouridine synthase [Viridibacillus soli]